MRESAFMYPAIPDFSIFDLDNDDVKRQDHAGNGFGKETQTR